MGTKSTKSAVNFILNTLNTLKIKKLSYQEVYNLLENKSTNSSDYLEKLITQDDFISLAELNFFDNSDSNTNKLFQRDYFISLFKSSKGFPTDEQVNISRILLLLLPFLNNNIEEKTKIFYYCLSNLEKKN